MRGEIHQDQETTEATVADIRVMAKLASGRRMEKLPRVTPKLVSLEGCQSPQCLPGGCVTSTSEVRT